MIKIFGLNILSNKELNLERARGLLDLASYYPNFTKFVLVKRKNKIYWIATDYCFCNGKKVKWKKELKKEDCDD